MSSPLPAKGQVGGPRARVKALGGERGALPSRFSVAEGLGPSVGGRNAHAFRYARWTQSGRGADLDKEVFRFDRVRQCDVEFGDDAGAGGVNPVLHFHRFHHEEFVATDCSHLGTVPSYRFAAGFALANDTTLCPDCH